MFRGNDLRLAVCILPEMADTAGYRLLLQACIEIGIFVADWLQNISFIQVAYQFFALVAERYVAVEAEPFRRRVF